VGFNTKEALSAESLAVAALRDRIGPNFQDVIQVILNATGRVVVCGMGKSGIVGQKLAATLASTGTPSFFLHPAEALHGDLGMLVGEDIVLLISNSGETDEVIRLIPALKHFGNLIIAMTGVVSSSIARVANYVLDVSVEREICPLNLAPTTSTLVTMAMGDAIAVALMDARGFRPHDFARFHPGGSLGAKLLCTVNDRMFTSELPVMQSGGSLKDAMLVMTQGRLGLAVILRGLTVIGVLTDGDLRRAFLKPNVGLHSVADDHMTRKPLCIGRAAPIFEAEQLMHEKKVKSLVVVEDSALLGIVELFERK
jgi:arabinose-5-phosphate isomerase